MEATQPALVLVQTAQPAMVLVEATPSIVTAQAADNRERPTNICQGQYDIEDADRKQHLC